MPSGKSPILSRPPKPPERASTNALERLSALKEWTEEPSREAAAVVEVAKPTETHVERTDEAKVGQSIRARNKTTGGPSAQAAAHPWTQYEGLDVTSQILLRLPKDLHMKVKWLGDTTYGESMNALLVKMVEAEVKRMLSERGIKV